MSSDDAQFWSKKSLHEMTDEEWELLCDGCARCCMIKLEDEDTDEVHYTAMVCDLLDMEACRCTKYPQRHELVPDCVVLTPQGAAGFEWLPSTCAYKRLAKGQPLLPWHPLISGRQESVHEAGISVRGRVIAQSNVHEEDYEELLIQWVDQS